MDNSLQLTISARILCGTPKKYFKHYLLKDQLVCLYILNTFLNIQISPHHILENLAVLPLVFNPLYYFLCKLYNKFVSGHEGLTFISFIK